MEPLKRKKDDTSKKATGIFIAILLTASILGVIAYNLTSDDEENLPENAFEYKSYTWAEDKDGLFWVKGVINGKDVPVVFRADPRNISDIYITPDAVSKIIDAKKIYITFNPNEQDIYKIGIAKVQIERIINAHRIPVVGAYSEDSDPIDENVPVKPCSKSTDLAPIIMLKIGSETQITSGDCVYVQGKDHDELILAADKLGMHLVGINV